LREIFKSLQILPIFNSYIGFLTSWYSDWAMILTIQSLIPGRGRRFFPFIKTSDHLWSSPSILLSRY